MSDNVVIRADGTLTYSLTCTDTCKKLTAGKLIDMLKNLPAGTELDGINLVGDRCDLFVVDFIIEYNIAKNVAFIGVR